jgi:hypothetical protein
MLASTSQIDLRADTPLVDWSDLGVSGLLPTGTVKLLRTSTSIPNSGSPPGCNSLKKLNVTHPVTVDDPVYLSACQAVFTDQRPVGLAQDVDIVPKRSDRSILVHDFELDLRYATAQFDDQGVLTKQCGAK